VDDWLPEFPPVFISIGIKAVNTTTVSRKPSNLRIIPSVKVADEAGKPIIFQDATTSEIKPGCYVLDGLTVYKYVITEFEGVVLQNDIEAVFPS
jgi:hypothetical protein